MKNFCIFVDALNFIEDNLCSPISQEEIAAQCCCSLSALQKVWRYCSHTSIKEYISKRRLTGCAEEILRGGSTLTETALKYGYNSPEVFTRAFKKLWGVSPSEFKNEWHSPGIFPRIIPDENRIKGGNNLGRKVDISELYDMLKAMPESYVLCCDVVKLTEINDSLGREAGDLVILEAFKRIDCAAGDSMTAFRIGGDEFALVTGMSDKESVKALGESLVARNGEEVDFGGTKIPVSIRVGAVKLSSKHLRYGELFGHFQTLLENTRETETRFFFA